MINAVSPATTSVLNPNSTKQAQLSRLRLFRFYPPIMKILLIASPNRRRTKLMRWLRRRHAIIVGTGTLQGIHILEEIARCTPHLVAFAEERVDADTEAVLAFVAAKFQSLALVRLPFVPGDREVPYYWTDLLMKQLRVPVAPWVPVPYGDEVRLVFHDPQFHYFSQGDKIRAGSYGIERQCAGLFRLLDGAKLNHLRAKAYLTAIEASLPGLESELAYRNVHRSYKGLSWSRELVTKFVAVVVHYIPGVEVDYLPPPAPIHPSVDYVHYDQPMEARYALDALCQMQIHHAVAELLISSSQWIFTGQKGITLLAEQCQLFGLAGFMHQIAKAHIAVMNRWLIPANATAEEDLSREEHRQMGVVRDFWAWGCIFETPDMLPHLLRAYHDGSWKPEFVYPYFPSYAEFVEKFSTERGI